MNAYILVAVLLNFPGGIISKSKHKKKELRHDAYTKQCVNKMISSSFKSCTYLERDVLCRNPTICMKNFKMSVVKLDPYSERFKKIIWDVLKLCCGNCVTHTVINVFNSSFDIDSTNLSSTDLLFPVLGATKKENLHGYYFVPILDVPSGYYMRPSISPEDMTITLIKACLQLWPLGSICLLMALIAGFIIWMMETWINVHQFPRPFVKGVFEGFWWSFVSMTTVGYGDKYPKSWWARLFAILWILIGITVCSMFTASLTSAITTVASQAMNFDMTGSRIGVLRDRIYDTAVVIRQGGTPVQSEENVSTIGGLMQMLKDKKVEGIFLDKYTSANSSNQAFMKGLMRSEVNYDGEQFSYGVLFMNESDYHYFHEFVKDNRIHLEACVTKAGQGLVTSTHNKDANLFSLTLFWPSFLGTSGIIAVIVVFGILYELNKCKCCVSGAGCCGKGQEETHQMHRAKTNSTKKMLNQTNNQALEDIITRDVIKLVEKWKEHGMV